MESDHSTPYFCSVRVVLHDSMPSQQLQPDWAGQSITGYFRNIGVSGFSKNHAKILVEELVRADGLVDWAQSSWKSVDLLVPSIREKSLAVDRPSIWHVSGRAFFVDAKKCGKTEWRRKWSLWFRANVKRIADNVVKRGPGG